MPLITKGKKRRVCWQHGKLFRKGKCPVCRRLANLQRAAELRVDKLIRERDSDLQCAECGGPAPTSSTSGFELCPECELKVKIRSHTIAG